jgi:DNA-binding transcriptional LysR family regulator
LRPVSKSLGARRRDRLKDDLEAGRVDLAIGPFDHVSEALVQRRLFRQPYVSMCAADHPLAHGPVDLPRFLAAAPVRRQRRQPVRSHQPAAREGRRACGGALPGAAVHSRCRTSSAARDLVVTVPQKLAQRAAGPFGLAWITPPLKLPPLQTNIFWHRRYNQDPGNQWLRTLVAETFLED